MCYCFLTVIFSYLLCIIFYCFFCLFYFFFFFFFFLIFFFFFFFQAEDGIRDADVTGDQTCALPIFVVEIPMDVGAPAARVLTSAIFAAVVQATKCVTAGSPAHVNFVTATAHGRLVQKVEPADLGQIGRASCREKCTSGGAQALDIKK